MNAAVRLYLSGVFAQPGLFDEGVEAARNACVAGASLASAVMTAAAWYENPLTGTPALLDALERLASMRGSADGANSVLECSKLMDHFTPGRHSFTGDSDYSPGFGYLLEGQSELVAEACQGLIAQFPRDFPSLRLCHEHRRTLAGASGPMNVTGLCAFAFHDLRISADEAERTFLMLRVEVALKEAQRARAAGLQGFPFFTEQHDYQGPLPEARAFELRDLLDRVGIQAP